MSPDQDQTSQGIEHEMLVRLAECYHFYGAPFLASLELPKVGSAFWAWMIGLIIREQLAINPHLKEICGYGNPDNEPTNDVRVPPAQRTTDGTVGHVPG